MAEITKSEYEKALSICNKYLKQESNIVLNIERTIKSLLDKENKSKELNKINKWIEINKGDVIKMIEIPNRGNQILKEGEILKVVKVNKQSFQDANYFKKLEITFWAKIEKRKYNFKGTLYRDNTFHSNCVFKKVQ